MIIVKPIPTMPGYGASKGGYIYTCKNGKYGFKDTWSRLATYTNKRTHYKTVALRVNNKTVTLTVHQLVAVTWLGPTPKGLEVNHIDGNKANNRVSNLEYIDRRENLRHAYRLGLSKVPGTVLTPTKVLAIRASGESQKQLALQFGVSQATIWGIKNRKSWRHI